MSKMKMNTRGCNGRRGTASPIAGSVEAGGPEAAPGVLEQRRIGRDEEDRVDALRLTALANVEISRGEVGHRFAVLVDDGDVNLDEIDRGAKWELLLRWLGQHEGREAREDHEEELHDGFSRAFLHALHILHALHVFISRQR